MPDLLPAELKDMLLGYCGLGAQLALSRLSPAWRASAQPYLRLERPPWSDEFRQRGCMCLVAARPYGRVYSRAADLARWSHYAVSGRGFVVCRGGGQEAYCTKDRDLPDTLFSGDCVYLPVEGNRRSVIDLATGARSAVAGEVLDADGRLYLRYDSSSGGARCEVRDAFTGAVAARAPRDGLGDRFAMAPCGLCEIDGEFSFEGERHGFPGRRLCYLVHCGPRAVALRGREGDVFVFARGPGRRVAAAATVVEGSKLLAFYGDYLVVAPKGETRVYLATLGGVALWSRALPGKPLWLCVDGGRLYATVCRPGAEHGEVYSCALPASL